MAKKVQFDDANILVTGASAGIGTEFARQLAPRARSLILVARRGDRLEALKKELIAQNPRLRVEVIACDLTDNDATDRMLAQAEAAVGPIDVLINNAGMGLYGTYDRNDWKDLDRMLRLNVIAPALLTRRLVEPMIARGYGAILNVGSSFAFLTFPGLSTYVATKHFIDGWTESLRADLAGTGVVISQLLPGPVITEFSQVAGNQHLDKRSPAHLTAEECVRWTLPRFERGKALIVPGVLMNLMTAFGRVLPRVVLRTLNPFIARWMRKQDIALYPAKQLGYVQPSYEKNPADVDARRSNDAKSLVH